MNNLFAFGMPGGWEWIIIILVVLIFFGAKKIPELARGLGRGIREFKDATKEIKRDIDESTNDSTASTTSTTSTTSEDDKRTIS
ncbi:MAG: twin-arginine translocase TatA/TatE family subunit [Fulvivirga sp.]